MKTYKNNEDNKNNNLPIVVGNQINDSNFNDITGIELANLNKEDQIRLKEQEIKNYSIIEIPTILASHNDEEGKSFCSAEFIKQLSNGYYISGGTNNKLYVYNEKYKKILEIDDIKEWTYSIFERRPEGNDENKNLIQIITCCNRDIYLVDIDCTNINPNESVNSKERIKTQRYELPNMTCVSCVEMKNNNFAMIGLNNAVYFIGLFNKNYKSIKHQCIIDKTYRGLIKIKDNIIALTSNKVAVGGEDRLIFFNSNNNKGNKVSKEINDYSFTLTTNGLLLMQGTNKNNLKTYKILICACKKYLPNQKNGILLVNAQLEDNVLIEDPFYDTDEFEVYCFCPIKDSDLFFVGGFDNDINEGKIKLYKILYNEGTVAKTKIEFKQDIIFDKNNKNNTENFEGFAGPINCLIQSSNDGEILATCYDGNVYKFSSPNIDFYKWNN